MLILASASERRKQLLEQIAVTIDKIVPAEIDETPFKQEKPKLYAKRMADEKAKIIAAQHPDDVVVAADTVVACGLRILPKAASDEELLYCLKLISGRNHRVFTAVTVIKNGKASNRVVESRVGFKHLSAQEIKNYIACQEGIGKAGGYAIQGRAAGFVHKIIGSYSNIVGLPLFETRALLLGMGAINE